MLGFGSVQDKWQYWCNHMLEDVRVCRAGVHVTKLRTSVMAVNKVCSRVNALVIQLLECTLDHPAVDPRKDVLHRGRKLGSPSD